MKQKIAGSIETPAFYVLAVCLPLIMALLLILTGDINTISGQKFQIALVGYSVALLSFFAGTRFGILLNGSSAKKVWLIPFLVGPIFGIGILLLTFPLSVAVLAAAFGAHGAWDSWAAFKGKLPKQYASRRMLATIFISLLLIVILIAYSLGS